MGSMTWDGFDLPLAHGQTYGTPPPASIAQTRRSSLISSVAATPGLFCSTPTSSVDSSIGYSTPLTPQSGNYQEALIQMANLQHAQLRQVELRHPYQHPPPGLGATPNFVGTFGEYLCPSSESPVDCWSPHMFCQTASSAFSTKPGDNGTEVHRGPPHDYGFIVPGHASFDIDADQYYPDHASFVDETSMDPGDGPSTASFHGLLDVSAAIPDAWSSPPSLDDYDMCDDIVDVFKSYETVVPSHLRVSDDDSTTEAVVKQDVNSLLFTAQDVKYERKASKGKGKQTRAATKRENNCKSAKQETPYTYHDHDGREHTVPLTRIKEKAKKHECNEVHEEGKLCCSAFERSEHLKRHRHSKDGVGSNRDCLLNLFGCGAKWCKIRTKRMRPDNSVQHYQTHLKNGGRNAPALGQFIEYLLWVHQPETAEAVAKSVFAGVKKDLANPKKPLFRLASPNLDMLRQHQDWPAFEKSLKTGVPWPCQDWNALRGMARLHKL